MTFKASLFLENYLLFMEKAEIIIMVNMIIIIIILVFELAVTEEIRGYRKIETEQELLLITIIVVIGKDRHKKMWKYLEKIRRKEFSDLAENYFYYLGINKETTKERGHL